MTYLKHGGRGGPPKKAKKQSAVPEAKDSTVIVKGPGDLTEPALQHDINHVQGLDGVEQSLDLIAQALSRLTNEDYVVPLSLAQGHHIHPVKITFADDKYGDTMSRLLSAVERIADALARLAGLSRPRLEQWYEQEEYEPRYKTIAADGGAPGPKVTKL